MNPITKQIFLSGRECSTQSWFLRQGTVQTAPSEADRFRMLQGIEVGQLAHALYTGGKAVAPGTREKMLQDTQELIGDPLVRYIFEATFLVDECIVKVDVLERCETGWKVIEVKASFPDSPKIAEYIDDVTYTTMVVESAGLSVKEIALLLLSRDYRKGMTPQQLFQEIPVTDGVVT